MTTRKNKPTPGEAAWYEYNHQCARNWDAIAAAAIAAHEAKRESVDPTWKERGQCCDGGGCSDVCQYEPPASRPSPTPDAADVTRAGELLDDIVDELPVDSNDITDAQGGACVDLILRYGQAARAEGYAQGRANQEVVNAGVEGSLHGACTNLRNQLKAGTERAEAAERELGYAQLRVARLEHDAEEIEDERDLATERLRLASDSIRNLQGALELRDRELTAHEATLQRLRSAAEDTAQFLDDVAEELNSRNHEVAAEQLRAALDATKDGAT